MDATITDGDEDYVGLDVTDTRGSVHEIVVDRESGEIAFHDCGDYPEEPDERTNTEHELVFQARRYARYYVDRETEHETVPWELDPDRIEAVRTAVGGLSEVGLKQHFGEYYRQIAGHYEDDVLQPRDPPAVAVENDTALYELDVYLDADGDVEATSGVHVSYLESSGEPRTDWGPDPLDRDPDARLQHVPFGLSWADLPDFLDYHLRCRIRDCYVAMGLEPPEEYRLLGPGIDKYFLKYTHFDVYPPYHDPTASVPGYRMEANHLPESAGILDLL